MLYLITGANGAGKTLNTLKWVRERSVKENRPVCHNGRFEPVEGGELSTWKKIDFKDWQDEPDGTIFLIDECHNDMPLRPPSATPPDAIKMLAEHRRRGFDFYLVTQHPQNIDSFVRRLIGAPGWHRHLKRTFGGDLVSCIEWAAVNAQCEKNGSGKTGTVSMVAFPKEVFTWYKSASLHTGKKKIPKAVYMLALCVLIVPLLIWYASGKIMRTGEISQQTTASTSAQTVAAVSQTPQQIAAAKVVDYVDARMPRLPDFPHTAPVYDDTTKPQQAPYPAACIHMGKTCKCYTQQATLMHVSGDVCLQIVRQGFFLDWQREEPKGRPQLREELPRHQPEPVRVMQPLPQPVQQPQQQPYAEWSQALAKRNSEVLSQFER